MASLAELDDPNTFPSLIAGTHVHTQKGCMLCCSALGEFAGMPFATESLDSLPYIDTQVTDHERENIRRVIAAELPSAYQTTLHPSLRPLPNASFSDLIQTEIDRIASGLPREGGIDLSRYEAPDEPSSDSDVDTWRSSLREAYRSASYLSSRHVILSLLEELGKNAWLVGNSQLEDILRSLEKELSKLKEETENVNLARKTYQEGSRGELVGLEEAWRTGVGKIIEVQVATDGLKKEILKRRRVH